MLKHLKIFEYYIKNKKDVSVDVIGYFLVKNRIVLSSKIIDVTVDNKNIILDLENNVFIAINRNGKGAIFNYKGMETTPVFLSDKTDLVDLVDLILSNTNKLNRRELFTILDKNKSY
jgi:hypothetical protein